MVYEQPSISADASIILLLSSTIYSFNWLVSPLVSIISSALAGIIFLPSPAVSLPTFILVAPFPFLLTACRLRAALHAASSAFLPSSGYAPAWACLPWNVTSNLVEARNLSAPHIIVWLSLAWKPICIPIICVIPLHAPALIIGIAPRSPSSAGWNINLMLPFKLSLIFAIISAAASPNDTWASCPQACIAPLLTDEKFSLFGLWFSSAVSVTSLLSISKRKAR